MKMKQGLKKLLALVLVLSMILSMGLTAFAEEANDETVISEVSLTGLPVLGTDVVADQGVPTLNINVPENAGYKIDTTYTNWVDGSVGSTIDANAVFVQGHMYYLNLRVVPAEGYKFAEAVDVMLDGESKIYPTHPDDGALYLDQRYSFCEVLDNMTISLTNVPTAEVGKPATTEGITTSEGNYHLASASWYDDTTQKDVEVGAVFEKGHKYMLNLGIIPNDGYEFGENIKVTVNGVLSEDGYVDYSNIYRYQEYSFLEQLEDETIDLTIPNPEVGKTASSVSVKVPENANYEIDEVYWFDITDEHKEMAEDDVFQKGHVYQVGVDVVPKTGYEFKEDLVINVNGEEAENSYNVADWAHTFVEYSLRDKINKIEVNGVQEAEVGKTVTYTTIKVPENANYVLDSVNWNDETTGTEMKEGDVFQKGHKYTLSIDLSPKSGCEFTEDAVAVVNGNELNGDDYWVVDTYANIYQEYSFLEQISKIEILEELPDAVAGEKATDVEIKTPDGAKYKAAARWSVYVKEDGYVPLEEGDVFQEGNAYVLSVVIEAEEGYEFTDDVEVTVAGKPLSTVHYYNYGEIFFVEEVHDLGKHTISAIEITIDAPKAGAAVSTKSLKVPENANYEVVEPVWYDAETGRVAKGTFEKGKKYELRMDIFTKEGYLLASDCKIKVNGNVVDRKALSENSWMDPTYAYIGVVYDLSERVVPTSPQTGDSANLILWIALATISITGVAVVSKKRRNA